jgi:hypothetical protein
MFGNRTDRRDRSFFRELAGAWIVTFGVVALGLAVTAFSVPNMRDRVSVPRWYDPPVAGADISEDDAASAARGADMSIARAGNDAATDPGSSCDEIVGSASCAAAPTTAAVRYGW